jgi:hypothetical protein
VVSQWDGAEPCLKLIAQRAQVAKPYRPKKYKQSTPILTISGISLVPLTLA